MSREWNLDEWQRALSYTVRDPEPEFYAYSVATPQEWAEFLAIRRAFQSRGLLVPPVEFAECHVVCLGEPPERNRTKIGGIPFRPRSLPWPRSALWGGPVEDMSFLCQFNFTSCRDLVPALPGDILLIFVADWDMMSTDQVPERFHFEWQPSVLENMVEPAACPAPSYVTCYGSAQRIPEYNNDVSRKSVAKVCCPDAGDHPEAEVYANSLCCVPGFKMGGSPVFTKLETQRRRERSLDRFLCSLCPINPRLDTPFPFANCPDPILSPQAVRSEWPPSKGKYGLYSFDGFILDFFLQPDGSVSWEMDLF